MSLEPDQLWLSEDLHHEPQEALKNDGPAWDDAVMAVIDCRRMLRNADQLMESTVGRLEDLRIDASASSALQTVFTEIASVRERLSAQMDFVEEMKHGVTESDLHLLNVLAKRFEDAFVRLTVSKYLNIPQGTLQNTVVMGEVLTDGHFDSVSLSIARMLDGGDIEDSVLTSIMRGLKERRDLCLASGAETHLQAYLIYAREVKKFAEASSEWGCIDSGMPDSGGHLTVYKRLEGDTLMAVNPGFGVQLWDTTVGMWLPDPDKHPLLIGISQEHYAQAVAGPLQDSAFLDRTKENHTLEHFLRGKTCIGSFKHPDNRQLANALHCFRHGIAHRN